MGDKDKLQTVEIKGKFCRIYTRGESKKAVFLAMDKDSEEEFSEVIKNLKAECKDESLMIVGYEANDWAKDYSPWSAQALDSVFQGGGKATLTWLTEECLPYIKENYDSESLALAGYSLAGLFSIWAFYESKAFTAAAACSASLWYPGWEDYAKEHFAPAESRVYLSLGKKESKTKTPLLSQAREANAAQYERLNADPNVEKCAFVLHDGGHGYRVAWRIAQGIGWLLT